ncbi:MAG: D-alanine--D-alanine ligase, partial [bacterium]|nr:D-alanine--D-alanine ligase [bacterium]
STLGVSIVNKSGIKSAVKKAMLYSKDVFIEEFIDGIEVTQGIIGDKILTPLQIIPKHRYYDFYSKYAPHGSKHIEFRASKKLIEKLYETTTKIFKILGLKAVARIDYRIKNEDIYFLEANTIPGLTSTSLLPHAAKIDGYRFIDLIKKIIEFSIED